MRHFLAEALRFAHQDKLLFPCLYVPTINTAYAAGLCRAPSTGQIVRYF